MSGCHLNYFLTTFSTKRNTPTVEGTTSVFERWDVENQERWLAWMVSSLLRLV